MLYHVISTNSSALLMEQTNLAKSGTAPFTHFLEVLTERRISRAKDEWHWHLGPATWQTLFFNGTKSAVGPFIIRFWSAQYDV